ncbi:MAG: prepilin-type N-terminal cleavage/methylation domain-containing protein [Candidatus Shapirobacteria bacterium]|nr:prepilin-type N-terminal cleavage/methylation domain-containing protein [Candidatus Shapirobacteria bacterium]MDD3002318.1 prepilin-type N-terminal cleavage/methylation domain-containing protein [Candidatus Shapirobacteria bacterium]MDD4382677.1 prepilin-type N-terminal cleavage/methylation domain-containing protein [Candidatus Shapirobacteria bacterium]
MKKNKNIFGFTLVELLVVISIIGILTMIGAVAYSGVQKKARDVERKSNLDALSKALMMYYNDTGFFPALTFDQLFATDVGFTGDKGIIYMREKPIDPKDTGEYKYVYKYSPDVKPKEFNLFANLENKSDAQCVSPAYSVGTSFCYGISSPNISVKSWF